jgi:hypothetical protein
MTGWFSGSPLWAHRRARPAVNPAHLTLELTPVRPTSRATDPILIEKVREQILLLIGQSVEEGEQVGLVPQDVLCRDDGESGGLADDDRGLRVHERLRKEISQSLGEYVPQAQLTETMVPFSRGNSSSRISAGSWRMNLPRATKPNARVASWAS